MLSMTEQLLHSTVRIECLNAKGAGSSGTGFFFNFAVGNGRHYPVIVTNKHVVVGQTTGFLHFTAVSGNDQPNDGKHERIEITDFGSGWLLHPDPNVDLAICPFGHLFNQLDQMGKRPFFIGIEKGLIADGARLAELNAVEDIMMIGYPNGLWDAKNNLPIVRRGITATGPPRI